MQQKISPHLWFDKEAKEAAQFCTSIFGDSKITGVSTLHGTPSGDTDIVNIELFGQEFTLISAGPLFKLNPSVSFLVACKSQAETDLYYNELSRGGSVLMELGSYRLAKDTHGSPISTASHGS